MFLSKLRYRMRSTQSRMRSTQSRLPLAICIAICALACMPWSISYAQTLVTDGLISYWPMDAEDIIDGVTVRDVVGGSDGTISGDPEVVEGHVGDGLYLDGEDDFIRVPDAPEQHMAEVLSICLWFRNKGTIPGNEWPPILRKGSSAGMNYYLGIFAYPPEKVH